MTSCVWLLAGLQPAMHHDELRYRAQVVEVDHRHPRTLDRGIGQDRDIGRILIGEQRLAVGGTVDLELVVWLALEALDHQQIYWCHVLCTVFSARTGTC